MWIKRAFILILSLFQAEIQRLREAHKAASQERKLLLLQQQDIARLQQSAQHYKEKIKRYSAQQQYSREASPFPDFSPSPSPSPAPSVDLNQEEVSVL